MARFRLLAACLALLMPWAGPSARAAEPSAFTPAQRAEIVDIVRAAMRADPSILRDAVTALQADEAARRQASARAAIGQLGPALERAPQDPIAGDPKGDVTLVEFYDLRCPYCRSMLPVVAELLRDDPHLRLVYKDIPVLGPPSVLGARAVLAAQRQGGYDKLRQAIMTGGPAISEDSLHAAADRAGLDWPMLRHDMDDPAIAARIESNLGLAHALGVNGTPTYVVGSRLMPGAVSLDELRHAVDATRANRG